jgi:hypothetical protein
MTGVTITFVSESVINIANTTGVLVDFEISKLLTTGSFDTAAILTVAHGSDEDYTINDIGLYKIWNPNASEGNTIIILSDILDELEDDVKEVLLAEDINKNLPKGYDFITLALLSIVFIGNTPYQNASYSTGSLTQYTTIAEAIDRCDKYFDRQNNTPQSTNKVWQ